MSLTTASCPRCGSAAEPESARCGRCGFVFFEQPEARSLPARWRWIAAGVLALAVATVAAVLLTRDSTPELELPEPVPRASAELRLERQLAAGPGASVRCPGPIDTYYDARCQFIYPDGDTQLMLVTLSREGELEIEVPYPAQRRPAR